jgi:hypothetical protein
MKSLLRVAKILLIQLMSLSHFVNRKYYLNRYPDIAAARLDPVEHYLFFGFREGRSPNRWYAACQGGTGRLLCRVVRYLTAFDDDYYLTRYPDVAMSGIDPVMHYMRYGVWEGRIPSRKRPKHERSLNLTVVLLSAPVRRQSFAWTRFCRDVIFGLARTGHRRAVRVAISIARALARRRAANVFVQCFPIADLTGEAFEWVSVTPIETAKPYCFREPEIIGEDASRTPRSVEVPSKWVASIRNASILGGFQVVAQDHFILYEPAGAPHNDFVAGSWPYVAGIKNTASAVVWYEYKDIETIPEGILISGRCSPNYYHWLIEYLARMYAVRQSSKLDHVPLIVDAGMYQQEFESLAAVCPGWPIYPFKQGTLLEVERLHIPSIPTFLPDTLEIPFWQASALCESTLAFLRTTVFSRYAVESVQPTKKIFLARLGARNIANAQEIEAVLAEFDFEWVDTASLTFEEQVRLFARAAVIVGPLGAAFSNVIFCDPRCKILGLATPYGKRFCMQANLAAFVGCEYKILAGEHPLYKRGDEHVVRDVSLMHESFSVSPHALRVALEGLEASPAL